MTARPVPTDYLPPHLHQLDGTKYAGGNCGPTATAMGLAWSTGGRVAPSPAGVRRALDGVWVGQKADPPTNATSLSDLQRAWSTFRDNAKAKGLRLGAFVRELMAPWSAVDEALDAGKAVILQYDYGTIRELVPGLSGSPSFTGMHVAIIFRRRVTGRRKEYLVYDGLYDGRRKGIPKGPQWVPAWALKRAAEDKIVGTLVAEGASAPAARRVAEGKAVFATITRSTVIAKPQPEPEPTCDERIADALEAATEPLQARITALTIALGSARTTLLRMAEVGTAADVALDDIAETLGETPESSVDPEPGVGSDS